MKLSIIQILAVFLMFITLSNSALSKSRTNAEANFSFTNLNLKFDGVNNFKGHVGLDADGKGIVVSPTDNDSNDKMLRLISEKLDSDAYLIDFRIFRSCDMSPKVSRYGKNLSLTFSPKSLENRSKNEKFDVTVEIMDFRTFISEEKYQTEEQIKDFLLNRCSDRKNAVNSLKRILNDSIKSFTDNTSELFKLNEKISLQYSELNNLKAAVEDTKTQINDINFLQNSYKMQLRSIDSLTNGANKLIDKETKKQKEIKEKENALDKKLKKKLDHIKNKEGEIAKEKIKFHKLIEESKDVENNFINHQKNLAEEENILSNINSNKMKISYDLKNAVDNLNKVQENQKNLILEIEKLQKVNTEKDNKLKFFNNEKIQLSGNIDKEKLEIENLTKRINDLILEKSKKEETLKQKYDELNNKETDISKLRIELDSNISEMKNLQNRKSDLKDKDEKSIKTVIQSLEGQMASVNESYEKANQTVEKNKEKLNEASKRKNEINKKSENNKNNLNFKNQELIKYQSEKNELEKFINDSLLERKNKEMKLKNLRNESSNYKNEIMNINKSLLSAQENLETFNSISSEFKAKLVPVEAKYNSLLKEKMLLESTIKSSKTKIKSTSSTLKKETPSATIMIDLAEDEALNNANNDDYSSGKNSGKDGTIKWRQLIDNIIS